MHINKTGFHWIIVALILFAIATRLVPHPPNFTPIGAIGLFAGCYLTMKRFWIVPLVALLFSDYLIGFYHPISMFSVYISFAISAFIGRLFLHNKLTTLRVGGFAFVSATQFFVITNLGVWFTGMMYPMSLSGLIDCYVMAIPFYGNTLLGDLFYVVTLFGIYEGMQVWIQKRHITQAA